jgi:AhpD family alkylhydroperoxidase
MDGFSRRRYLRARDALTDMREISRHRRQIRVLMSGEVIDRGFRERLMLAVTEVNGCRYCSYGHARAALAAGLTQDEVKSLLEGDLADSPPDEVTALLYAQHWAETETRPDPEVRRRVVDIYGETKTEYIELAMRMIRVGNLLGNSGDYLLYKCSGGRWGDHWVSISAPAPSPDD